MTESKNSRDETKKATNILQPQGLTVTIPCIPYSSINYGVTKVKLGQGGYGAIFLGHIKGEDGEEDVDPVAVKEFFAQDFSEKTKKEVEKEARMMAIAGVSSKYLMGLKAYCLEPYCLLMERMDGSLYDLLHSDQEIPWKKRYHTGLDVSRGMYYLHTTLKTVHGDLKSLNVLVTSKRLDFLPLVKISDFGSVTLKNSSLTATSSQVNEFRGANYNWSASELFVPYTEPTFASDIWSLGMVLYEIATREIPFKEAGNRARVWIEKGAKPKFPKDTPVAFKEIAEKCWKKPEERPSALAVAKLLESLWEKEDNLREKKQDSAQEIAEVPHQMPLITGCKQFIHQPTDIKIPKRQEEEEIGSLPDLVTLRPKEKKYQQLTPLQNELITACENGNLFQVKATIDKGALVNFPYGQGKNPLFSAVYGMNPEVVKYVIKQRSKDVKGISWQACEEHNTEYYGQTFLIMKFDPDTYQDWYQLLIKIEHNGFLAEYHIAQVQYWWGKDNPVCSTFDVLKKFVDEGRLEWSYEVPCDDTEKGFDNYRDQIKQAMEALQATTQIERTSEREEPSSSDQFISTQPTDIKALGSRKIVQIDNLFTPSPSALVQPLSSNGAQSHSSIPAQSSSSSSIYTSSSTFFGVTSSPTPTSLEAKTAASLDEKKRQQLLQNELIEACENGNLLQVKATIAKGALIDFPYGQGKNPLFSAVYGMSPDVVNYLIAQFKEEASSITWEACEGHNKEHYGQTFLIMKFAPYTYRDWYNLLLKIEPNKFLSECHLIQVRNIWGESDSACSSWLALKEYVTNSMEWRSVILENTNVYSVGRTERELELNRTQIKRVIEVLNIVQNESVNVVPAKKTKKELEVSKNQIEPPMKKELQIAQKENNSDDSDDDNEPLSQSGCFIS
jgi:serine/threonine protein kinase